MRRFAPLLRRTALLLALAACGSRTGLFTDESFGNIPIDAGPDGTVRRDGGFDGEVEDALPPLDVQPPIDVNRTDCPDADATFVYVITTDYELFAFNPDTSAFRLIGKIACPAGTATPFSMAVDRKGVAYILFTDERLYRVSTLTAACLATTFQPGQSNFGLFGMGFATDDVGPTETLYVAGDDRDGRARGLARIDTTTFKLTPVGDFTPRIERSELTGTGDGRLFAFYTKQDTSPPSFIGEINPATAQVLAETAFPTVDQGQGWAFAFWGGDFYMFTAPGAGGSRVTRFRPADGSVTVVATLPTRIVGAGVSTCAPQQ